MTRGTFANVRIKNLMVPGVEGGVTRYWGPEVEALGADGAILPIFEAAEKYKEQGVPLIVIGGEDYGMGIEPRLGRQGNLPPRRQGRHHQVIRAHPSFKPCRDGRAAAAISKTRPTTTTSGTSRTPPSTSSGSAIKSNPGRRPPSASTAGAPGFEITVIVRIDTPIEVDYYRAGGILQFVLGPDSPGKIRSRVSRGCAVHAASVGRQVHLPG